MDYFDYNRRRNNSITQDRLNAPLPQPIATPGGGQVRAQRPQRPLNQSYESLRQPSSIRIQRVPSGQVPQLQRPLSHQADQAPQTGNETSGRRRSTSEPQRYGASLAPPVMDLSRQRTQGDAPHMPTVTEGVAIDHAGPPGASQDFGTIQESSGLQTPSTPYYSMLDGSEPASRVATGASALQNAGNVARTNRGLTRLRTGMSGQTTADEYGTNVIDLLDLVDPEVSTLGTLNNVQNSLFVPDLGRLVNRRPTYNLSRQSTGQTSIAPPRARAGTATRPTSTLPTIPQDPQSDVEGPSGIELQEPLQRRLSISSNMSDSRYAVLPHGLSLEGWSEEDKADLDDHVRHLLHSRREGFKRSMRGFKQYISKPLGLFVFIYATLVTLFGAAWVFFLIGWISLGSRTSYATNVIDNILVALFALMGDGLAPFRMVDTYHMIFIARYYHLTWRLRDKKKLPGLVDHNDLPDRRVDPADIEDAIDKEETAEFSVLKPIQQKRLQYHQAKFSKAHTFYRPHETATHHAFPLRLLVAVVVLLDCHSLFQVALGTCTWSWNYHTRPQALTATILSCSISCNITAGIVISVGDHRTRKKDVLERIARQNLTEEALRRMAKERQDAGIAQKSQQASDVLAEEEAERLGPLGNPQALEREDPASKFKEL